MVFIQKSVITGSLWELFQKVSGLVFVNPNIPALKYGRSMEENAVNEFFNIGKIS